MMLDASPIAIAACLVWWASTGAILSLIGRGESTYRWSMLGAALLGVAAIAAVVASSRATTTQGAFIAFIAAIGIWGAIEMSFLMGFVVGPRRGPCPPGLTGWQRFKVSFAALAHHELLLVAALAALAWLVADQPNRVALYTFALLWVMRLSTKLNIFLGVSNVSEEVLPARIGYLKSYFRKAPMNALFPLSVTGATACVFYFGGLAASPGASDFERASAALLATFSALALIEHWMLVLPLATAAIWPWAPAPERSAGSLAIGHPTNAAHAGSDPAATGDRPHVRPQVISSAVGRGASPVEATIVDIPRQPWRTK
ncbi:MAG TPA: putative photosynthetic complex assembly protein PuhE [Hyphomicrobiaceae bacterium]|nr:putative photosynthetic complex assembly protein PuhE [Hyphomicrobiaceae bacterium]